ncbi:MAG: helix-turn-helix transcriptional regulator [Hungatella sp.]|nr:helix-turn-helix transcriptional regulator [Hungatella sp.]
MKDQKDTIKQVIDYIEDNLENHISLDTIAQKTGYSKFYLNRVFTRQTGITIYKYLQNRRLTTAAEKLVHSRKPITTIAYEAGYDTQQSFTLAFKQLYRYPPNTYRKLGTFIPRQKRITLQSAKKSTDISLCHILLTLTQNSGKKEAAA